MIHELKAEKQFFDDCVEGRKTFEIRKDDRPFSVGDFAALNEIDANPIDCTCSWDEDLLNRKTIAGIPEYTGRCALFAISYVLRDERFVKAGYCVLGLRPARIGYHLGEVVDPMNGDPVYKVPVYDREGVCGR